MRRSAVARSHDDPGGGVRRAITLRGAVQGVGFRPVVFRLARRWGVGGEVQNRANGVRLVVEGDPAAVDGFLEALPRAWPGQARVDAVRVGPATRLAPDAARKAFAISRSRGGGTVSVTIPPDLAMCDRCRAEVLSPRARRYGYPFTTCTDCGPRLTVVTGLPYDRVRTTMAGFPLCPACRREYGNPADRRFHAETIACPRCGPRAAWCDGSGRPVAGDPIRLARAALARGAIVAMRGIGGFLLAVDARHREALARLRARKSRPHQPLALMARDLWAIRRACRVPRAAAALLRSAAAPIVLLERRPEAAELPVDLLAPDTPALGVMLPVSPLHLLLFHPLQGDPTPPIDWLVMTSGNRRGEPIAVEADEAFSRLHGIADGFLTHDRPIAMRNDDSVAVVRAGASQVWRAARGVAPVRVRLRRPLAHAVLAMGADRKNAVAFGRGREATLSPHIGDLDTLEAVAGRDAMVARLRALLRFRPQRIAVDLHPDMDATRAGEALAAAAGVPVIRVQHHHAHALAGMAEHGLEAALALTFDGTGLGADGTVWGGELLGVEGAGYRRLATLAGVPLPGGDAAVRRPVRQVAGRLVAAGGEAPPGLWRALGATEEEGAVWMRQAAGGWNAPVTHAAGRVFDAAAVLLGAAPAEATYEGQSAIRLETLACRAAGRIGVPWPIRERAGADGLRFDLSAMFLALAEEAVARAAGRGPDRARRAAEVHEAVVAVALRMAEYGAERAGMRDVVLSGGVFMNARLVSRLAPRLARRGFRVRTHSRLPPGDACVALGQVCAVGNGEEVE